MLGRDFVSLSFPQPIMDNQGTKREIRRALALMAIAASPVLLHAQPQIAVSPSSVVFELDAGEALSQVLQVSNAGTEPLDFILSTGPADVADSLLYYSLTQSPELTIRYNVAVRYQAPSAFTLDAAGVHIGLNVDASEATIDVEIRPVNPNQAHWPISLEPIGGGSTQVGGAPQQVVQVPLDEPLSFEAGEQFFVIVHVTGGRVARTGSYSTEGSGRQYYNGEYGWQIYHFGGWVMEALSFSDEQVLTADVASGTIPAGGQVDVTLTANASDLLQGSYGRQVQITSNDSLVDSLLVPVGLQVTGTSHLELSASALDFGTIVAGQSNVRMLTVGNSGTAPLTIDGADLTSTHFAIDHLEPLDLPLTLAPGADFPFSVRFQPDQPGEYGGTLVLSSDAANLPQAQVDLSGTAQPVPEVSVEPASIDLELTSGETEVRSLTLSNPGAGELQFAFDRFGVGHGEDTFGYRWVESTEAGGPAFDWVDIRSDETLLPFGTGTQVSTVVVDLPFPFPYYGEEYSSFRVSRNGAVTFSDHSPYIGSLPRPIPLATWPDNFIAPLWKNLRLRSDRGGIYAGTDDQGRFVVQWQELQANANLEADITIQLIMDASGDILFQYLTLSPVPMSSGYFSVGIENHDGTDGLQLAFNDDGFIRNNLAIRIAATPAWIASVEPAAGIVPAGSSQEVQSTFDPGGLLQGTYHSSIALNTNAPATPRVHVPVTLDVMGVPQLALSTTLLDFEEVFMTYSDVQSVTIFNTGTVGLEVSEISVYGEGFSVEQLDAFVVAPADSQMVQVTFAPESVGPYTGVLAISSDDPENPLVEVALVGQGIGIPEVAVSPEDLSVSIAAGESQVHTVTIENPGESDLHFSLGIRTPAMAGRGLPEGAMSEPAVVDSLVYDTGASEPAWMFGLSHTPLSFAVRYTAPYNFTLSAVRAYFTTDTSTVNVQVEIYRKGDGPHPSEGELLASWTLPDLVPEAKWVHIPLPQSLVFAEGEEFFAVLHFDNVTFPMGQHYGGPAQFWGRSSYACCGSGWWTVGPRWLIRALTYGGEFITADPQGGTVAPGETVDVAVTIDAEGLTAGSYLQELVVTSNDPVSPELGVPITVEVAPPDGDAPSIVLGAGWNLVSWNVAPPNTDPGIVLAGILDRVEKVKSYGDGEYVVYTPGAPSGENTLTEIDPMYSYWIRMSAPGTLYVVGAELDGSTPITLDQGLNAITYLPNHASAPPEALGSILSGTSSVMAFAGTGLTFAPTIPEELVTLTEMRSGSGYYLLASEAGTLVYPTAPSGDAAGIGSAAPTIAALREAEAEAGVTATMEWVSVWGDGVLLPDGAPLPAGTVVTVHTPDELTIGAFRILSDGRLGPMSIYANDPTTAEKDGASQGETVHVRVGAAELATLEWTSFGDVVDLSGQIVAAEPAGGVPESFALEPNYPNPFARSTTIRFGIPSAGRVTLTVYDALGRLVSTLVDDQRVAGWHDVRWETGELASGVYVYRLQAGSFTASRRMLIVK